MRLVSISIGSLVVVILAFLLSSCGEQSTGVPASVPTPQATPTISVAPPTNDTRTTPAEPIVTPTVTASVNGSKPVLTPTAGSPSSTASHGGPVQDYVSLIDNLRKQGATVNPVGDVTQPFFSVKGQIISVNGEEVQTFEYADAATAKAEATKISPDGSSIGTSMVSWKANPHFFQKERLIVLYVGTNPGVIQLLITALGPQVAGR